MTQKVPVGKNGLFALVDDEDYALVSQYEWRVSTDGYAVHNYREGGKNKALLMHRLILGLGPGDLDVDHANHDGLDNRRPNLRVATDSQNRRNSRKQRRGTASSRYKGVSWKRANQRWCASIRVQGKGISLGYFDAETDAARTYDAAAAHFYGEFACLNFPDEIPAPYVFRERRHSSECRGVCYSRTSQYPSKWRARFERNGKRYHVGMFPTEQAAIAALQIYKQVHGLST